MSGNAGGPGSVQRPGTQQDLSDLLRRVQALERRKPAMSWEGAGQTYRTPVGVQFRRALWATFEDGPIREQDQTNFYEGIGWVPNGIYASDPDAAQTVIETNDPQAAGGTFPETDPEMIQLSGTTEPMPSSQYPFGLAFTGDYIKYDWEAEPEVLFRIRRPGVWVYNINWRWGWAPTVSVEGVDWPGIFNAYVGVSKPNNAFDAFAKEVVVWREEPELVDEMQLADYGQDTHRSGLIYVSEDAAATDPAVKVHGWASLGLWDTFIISGEFWQVADWDVRDVTVTGTIT